MYKRDGFEDGKAFQAKKTAEQKVWRPEKAQLTCPQGMHVSVCVQSLSRV